jgi:protocatechuate 3,4-dioxygenase beta subunit
MRHTLRMTIIVAAAICCLASAEQLQTNLVSLITDDEPGRRLEFSGRVIGYDGRPLSKAAVIAYNTDVNGLYNRPNADNRIPRIRGVCVTDENGVFRFRTVWPGSYPESTEPAHIHLQAAAPAHHSKYADVWFEGDPNITPEKRRQFRGVNIVSPKPAGENVWTFEVDIRLDGN